MASRSGRGSGSSAWPAGSAESAGGLAAAVRLRPGAWRGSAAASLSRRLADRPGCIHAGISSHKMKGGVRVSLPLLVRSPSGYAL